MVVSMAIVPLMMRIAPRVGMVDMPDPRKVHTIPIARVGGIGIVIGALVPIVFWLPYEPLVISYLFGSLVLLVFGVWDDSCELGHYVKFIGQFAAVLPIIFYGDLYVSEIPVIGELSEVTGKIFTVVALVGVINAINHSDGLDGLAGGLSLLSLACLAYLFYLVNDFEMVFLSVSVMGGVFGFLRFNSHPAKVFMGDGGSQFLGFSLGFLVIVLTQKSHPALSSALPALILGLPVIDIIAVFYLRISGGMNWFRATRNHIHHRLLDLGFTHYESVILIYLVQLFMILSSIFLMYDYDLLILGLYFSICIFIFSALTILENKNYEVSRKGRESAVDVFINDYLKTGRILYLLGNYIVSAVALLFLFIVINVESIPQDVGFLSFVLLVLGVVSYFLVKKYFTSVNKLILYIVAALVIYLDFRYLVSGHEVVATIEMLLFISLAISCVLIIKFDTNVEFMLSPMDYLVATIMILTFTAFSFLPEKMIYGFSVIKLILLFYACELIEKKSVSGLRVVSSSAVVALFIVLYRSLM